MNECADDAFNLFLVSDVSNRKRNVQNIFRLALASTF